MRRWQLPVALLITLFIGGIFAAPAGAQGSCAAPTSTYDLIQRGIFEVHGCTMSYCHGENAQEGLDLRAGQSYASLFPHAEDPSEAEASEQDYDEVEPGYPDESFLWLKLAAKTLGTKGVPGEPMPLGRLPISTNELEGVRLWILAGAPQNGFVAGVSALIQPCAPTQPTDPSIPPPCSSGATDLVLPDLSVDPPKDIRVLLNGGHRVIQFTTSIANQGYGPLIVQAASTPTGPGQSLNAVQIILKDDGTQCSRPAGQIMYGVDGYKWAYGNMADFELRKDDPLNGPVVARASKSAFCLLDTDPINPRANAPHQFEAHCEDTIGRMGISAGYKDLYSRVYPAQWLDLDADPTVHVQPGTYYLVNVVDPTNTLLEVDSSQSDNSSYTRVNVNMRDPNPYGAPPTPTPIMATPTPLATRPGRPPHPVRPPRPVPTTRPGHPTPVPRPTRAPHSVQPPHHPDGPTHPQAIDRPSHSVTP
jgi:hypothetical protein